MAKRKTDGDTKAVRPTKGRPSTGAKARIQFELPKDELVSRGAKLSHLMRQIEVEEENAKAAAATARAKLKDLHAQAKDLSMQIGNGYEEREVDVLVEFDRKKGCKHLFIHAPGQEAHGRFVRTETMTEDDYALLPLEDKPRQPEPAPEPQPDGTVPDKEPEKKEGS